MTQIENTARRRSRRARNDTPPVTRKVDYRNLRNPFPMMSLFTEDRIEAIHEQALTLLETLGIKVLASKARD